jgi:hypothetical protein
MARWIVKGSATPSEANKGQPASVSEPFVTDDGAKSFARLLSEKGYVVSVHVLSDAEEREWISGPAVIEWMNSGSD